MKIDSKIQFPSESQPEHVSGKRANDVAPKAALQTAGFSTAAGEDTVSLSGVHGDVQRLTYAASQVPEVRKEQIAALQSKVQTRNYKPASEKIADALLSEQRAHKFRV